MQQASIQAKYAGLRETSRASGSSDVMHLPVGWVVRMQHLPGRVRCIFGIIYTPPFFSELPSVAAVFFLVCVFGGRVLYYFLLLSGKVDRKSGF